MPEGGARDSSGMDAVLSQCINCLSNPFLGGSRTSVAPGSQFLTAD